MQLKRHVCLCCNDKQRPCEDMKDNSLSVISISVNAKYNNNFSNIVQLQVTILTRLSRANIISSFSHTPRTELVFL